MPEITYSRDTVLIQTDSDPLYALPPVHRQDTTEFWRAAVEGRTLSKDQAELLARTVAPHLFSGPEKDSPLQRIHADLSETVQSYNRDLEASIVGSWDEEALTESLSGLLEALNGTLSTLEDLL